MHIDTRDRRHYAAELKFLVSADAADAIRAWARAHLTADPHGGGDHADEYETTTLYTDTVAQDVYHRRGSYGRSKYRVRRYGASDLVFLERKLRTKALLSKRRSLVPQGDLPQSDRPLADLAGWQGAWFAGRLAARRLAPVCQVSYVRTARVISTACGLARLTVDTNLKARAATRWAFESPDYRPVMNEQQIVEMKFLVTMPAVFKALLETFGLAPVAVSKYRMSAEALGQAATPATEPANRDVA
jgi:hypothetical protein